MGKDREPVIAVLGHAGEDAQAAFVVVQREPDLFEVILALGSSGGFPGLLHGGQQECNQHRNDGNDNEQLNECKAWSGFGR